MTTESLLPRSGKMKLPKRLWVPICLRSFFSPRAWRSSHVNREIQFALSENKPILPVFLEEITLTPSLKLCLQQFQSCFYYKIGWQKSHRGHAKVLTKAESQGNSSHFIKRNSTGEEVLDEGEALWKIMEQVLPPKSIGTPGQKPTLPRRSRGCKQREKADADSLPSIRPSSISAKPNTLRAQQTRHPFAVGVIVDEPESKIQQDNTVFSDSYLGDLSWIPSGKITVRVPYSSDVRLVHRATTFG